MDERSTERGRAGGEESRDEKCDVVAAVESGEGAGACDQQSARDSGSEAGKDGETQRAAHHERGVDDSRGKAGFSRRNVAHSSKQHRVERHAGAKSKQDHTWEHICDEVPRDRCPCEESKPDRGQQQSYRERQPDAEPHDEPGGEAERESTHNQVGRQEGETDLQRAVAEHQLEVES